MPISLSVSKYVSCLQLCIEYYKYTFKSISTSTQTQKENRVLSAELSSVTDQLSEGGKVSHEIEKMRRKLELEKEELGTALEEAETALEIEEGKLLKVNYL